MRFLPILLILFMITACTSESLPDAVSTGFRVELSPVVTASSVPITASPLAVLMSPQEIIQCSSAPATRLIVQERGRVSDSNNDTLNLRSGPGISFDILIALNPRDEFTVIEGPVCAGEFAWFRIRFHNTIGWIAEGDNEDYYVEPYLSG